jgi:hypothetical protein
MFHDTVQFIRIIWKVKVKLNIKYKKLYGELQNEENGCVYKTYKEQNLTIIIQKILVKEM